MIVELLPDGSVTSPSGFRAAGVSCGLKAEGALDLGLLSSEAVCDAAGVFTRNRVVAAPVELDRASLEASGGRAVGVVANSGNANACTGEPGRAAARLMQARGAAELGCAPEEILVLSTGVIGVPLDAPRVGAGIAAAAAALRPGGGRELAEAIMTTDTRPKHLAARVVLSGGVVTIGGVAKGSGMIHPDMATMLGLITTDASLPEGAARAWLREAVDASFHRITVDGDTSTNDSVLLLANGASGVAVDAEEDARAFRGALALLCRELAWMIVRDGEGVRRFVTIEVRGAATDEDARAVARTVATSPLVKTAFAGGDPNWGRIVAAAGRAGAALQPERLALRIGPGVSAADGPALTLVEAGGPTDYPEPAAAAIFGRDAFRVELDLGLGEGEATIWTGDLTADYVRINADYRS